MVLGAPVLLPIPTDGGCGHKILGAIFKQVHVRIRLRVVMYVHGRSWLQSSSKWNTVEPLFKGHPDVRTPLDL